MPHNSNKLKHLSIGSAITYLAYEGNRRVEKTGTVQKIDSSHTKDPKYIVITVKEDTNLYLDDVKTIEKKKE